MKFRTNQETGEKSNRPASRPLEAPTSSPARSGDVTSTRHLSFAMFRAALRRASTHASLNARVRGAFRALATSATQKTGGIYEVRTYDIEPSRLDEYLAMCADSANERKKVTNEGFVGFFVTELGGDAHEVTHVYRYDDYDARDDARNAMKRSETWTAFLKASKPMVRRQKSEIFLEATKATASAGMEANDVLRRAREGNGGRADGVFEWRRYQLELGYNPIPKLVDALAKGLPSKLASDRDGRGELVWMGYSDVGKLNQFVELWRYDCYQDHIKAREAARSADAWRAAINEIAPMVQMFDTQLMRPAAASPIK
jgi:hypothetical protein|tara:strand:- start:4464 stop:5405 length:942 start_codon:yes stop_codon:yes gene_type:complete